VLPYEEGYGAWGQINLNHFSVQFSLISKGALLFALRHHPFLLLARATYNKDDYAALME